MNHRVRCGPTMFTKQVSGQSRSPIVAAKAQQVEPTRTKTWSQARSEVFVPYSRHSRARVRAVSSSTSGQQWRMGNPGWLHRAPTWKGCELCSAGPTNALRDVAAKSSLRAVAVGEPHDSDHENDKNPQEQEDAPRGRDPPPCLPAIHFCVR
jgi:hypothetical protein